jgi:predicted RNA binding protein YcfA (HicA-like mRNA interferase family)
MPMPPKEMVKYLKQNGFVEVRQRGSHIFLENYQTNKRTTVPMHCKELGVGLERKILKDAGLL